MKFGVREICDVVLRAKSTMYLGKLKFDKDMPVLYFDSLKTSSLEGAATTVYAQGGKGNVRLIAWEGEKTLTFTMEDALISKESLAVLSGADLIHASENNVIPVHTVEKVFLEETGEGDNKKQSFILNNKPYEDKAGVDTNKIAQGNIHTYIIPLDSHGDITGQPYRINLSAAPTGDGKTYNCTLAENIAALKVGDMVLVDYYVEKKSSVTEIDITPEKFAGNYYLEASTLFRNKSGVDLPAEFIIPNCKIQSNFTFSMAPTGDPSTFTFTLDAFPDYTKYNRKKKVLAAIQVIEEASEVSENITYTSDYTAAAVTAPSGGAPVINNEQPSGDRFKRSNSILNNEN